MEVRRLLQPREEVEVVEEVEVKLNRQRWRKESDFVRYQKRRKQFDKKGFDLFSEDESPPKETTEPVEKVL